MVSTIKKAFAASLFITSSLSVLAVPAKPGLLPMTQPDGTVVNVRLMGDEFHHFYLSEDGYYLVNEGDTFYYADVDASGLTVSSGIKAEPAARRSAASEQYLSTVDMPRVLQTMQLRADARLTRMAQTTHIAPPAFAPTPFRAGGPGLFPGTHFPAMGEQKGLVILVEYQDVKMTLDNPHDYFYRMLNEPGFSDYEGTGSAVDFFAESSEGQFAPQFDVYGPVTLSKNRSYYGGNGWTGDDQHPADMVKEACDQLDGIIDFTEYDRDGDGEVDNVFIFYAGRGEASGGPAESVWPHAWNVEHGIGYKPTYDGVSVSRYACSNEWESGRPDGVGTFIHEFSHVMGLPDLYATSYTSSFTPGSWSCMDYGPYNNDGCTPPLYGAFERYALGWMEPMVIDGPLNAVLEPISSNKAGIIRTPKSNEFFLLENRQQTSWDTYIPGHGMLIWHIDYNSSVWDSNKVNNTPSHQYVDIEEADGSQTEYSRSGDAFPGTSHVTSFTDTTNPNMKTWAGRSLNIPITDIAESASGLITFKACGGRTEPLPGTVALEAEDADDESFTAMWQEVPGSTYLLTVYTRPDGSDVVTCIDGYDHRNVGPATSCRVEGLEAGEIYYYIVAVSNGWEMSEESNEIMVTTGQAPIYKLKVNALQARDAIDNGFAAAWEKMDVANDYILTVYTKELTGHYTDGCDFTAGIDKLPAGWSANTGSSYANTAYSGKAIPAIRLGRNADAVTTPEYEDDIKSVSFWHRGNGTADNDMMAVSVRTADGWQKVGEVPVVKTQGGTVTTIEVDVPGARIARVEFVRNSGKGAVALDDIEVAHGMTFEPHPVAGYRARRTGDRDSYEVRGLNPGTTYYYTVTATDGEQMSKPSDEIEVVTSGNSAITDITASEGVRVSVSAGTVSVSGLGDDEPVTVYDLSGRTVATGRGDSQFTLSGHGVYIVSTPRHTQKIIL